MTGATVALSFPWLSHLSQHLVGMHRWSWKPLGGSKPSILAFYEVMGQVRTAWENCVGSTKPIENVPSSFYMFSLNLDNLSWHLGKNNIHNSKQNIPKVVSYHITASTVSNNIYPLSFFNCICLWPRSELGWILLNPQNGPKPTGCVGKKSQYKTQKIRGAWVAPYLRNRTHM